MSNKLENTIEKACVICNENQSKYCCPKCGILYCSLNCYTSEIHQDCSESFYRDCVNEELASQQVDDKSKRKMIDILKRMKEHGDQNIEELLQEMDNEDGSIDSDDDNELDLHERIKDLNLDDANVVWSALTQDERNEFEAILSQGDIDSIIPQWEPWWMYRREEKLIEDVSEKFVKKEVEALKNCPEIIDVPKFSSLTTVQPSPTIKFNITNILASYAFIMRYFNGDVEATEAVTYFLNICGNLDCNSNFDDLAIAAESVAQKCLQSHLIETDKQSLAVMRQDTFLILQGPSKENKLQYCKSALSHTSKIFSQAKINSKNKCAKFQNEFTKKFPDHGGEYLQNLDISKVKKCIKKLEYYLAYIDSYGMDF